MNKNERVTPYRNSVYTLLRKVPKGKVTSYGAIALALGKPSARAVGQALRCNPFAPTVPCHRVVRSDGSLGGFDGATAGKSIERKIALLREEGVVVRGNRVVDFEHRYYQFPHARH